jgi:hypothetical protein
MASNPLISVLLTTTVVFSVDANCPYLKCVESFTSFVALLGYSAFITALLYEILVIVLEEVVAVDSVTCEVVVVDVVVALLSEGLIHEPAEPLVLEMLYAVE